MLTTLQASSPGIASPIDQLESSDATIARHLRDSRQSNRRTSSAPATPIQPEIQPEVRGWNEYDNGSEAGDEAYYIDINPDESDNFLGMNTIRTALAKPVKKIQSLFSRSSDNHTDNHTDNHAGRERESLLPGRSTPQADYFTIRRNSVPTTDGEATDDDASSTEYPSYGYSTHYAALPSVEAQRVARFRELVLHRSVVISFTAAVILTLVAAILVGTGRHRLRLEVDAGVTLAVVASLFAGCMGLSAMLYREDRLSWMYRLTVWVTFIAACLLNGMLLVVIVGSNSI